MMPTVAELIFALGALKLGWFSAFAIVVEN
jgi:hypothetical protein